MTADAAVLDVTDATFATEVLERSRTVPVVVDFWAPWCGPCRVLGPTIEKVAAEHGGDVQLVKLNTDENPRTSMQYRIQGIPAVKAFVEGRVAAEFTGAVPEAQVRAFFQRLAPSPEEKAAREAEELASQDPAAAEQRFRDVLSKSPNNVDAIVGLGAILMDRGDLDAADDLLERAHTDRRAKVLRHHILLEKFAEKHESEDLQGEASRNPGDPRARYRWGVMLAAEGRMDESLDELLESVTIDRSFADGAARKAMLAVFDILGLDSQLTREYQRRLSTVLF